MRRGAVFALTLALLLCACAGSPEPAPDRSVSTLPEISVLPEPEPEPEPPTAEEQLRAILAGMTDGEKVGQLFFVRCPEENPAALAEEYGLGGYILFGRDFKDSTPEQVREKLIACQQGSKIPMLMGVDEEGGAVVRVSRYPAFRERKFRSPQALFAKGGLEAIEADAGEKSGFLLDLGLNVNFAPVCDVSTDPKDFIYDRSFGKEAAETAEYVRAVVSAMNERGMGSVLKHFPGYGNNADTHTGIALDNRPLERFLEHDLLPFRAGIEAGAGAEAVLMSHNIVACLDSDLPASLAPEAYALLRKELGFDGVTLTDDLDMGAVKQYVEEGSAAALALKAGADMVLTGDPKSQIPQVLAALASGELTRERVEEAALRVLRWKLNLGLIVNF